LPEAGSDYVLPEGRRSSRLLAIFSPGCQESKSPVFVAATCNNRHRGCRRDAPARAVDELSLWIAKKRHERKQVF